MSLSICIIAIFDEVNQSKRRRLARTENGTPTNMSNHFLYPSAPDRDRWKRAPILVGGTGGSGTRGVVDILQSLGVYMV
jgi:hypothetical protein